MRRVRTAPENTAGTVLFHIGLFGGIPGGKKEQFWNDFGAVREAFLELSGPPPGLEIYEMFPTPTGRARARSARARAQPRLKPLAALRLGTPAPTQSYRLGVLLRGLRSMRSHCSSSCRLLWRSILSRLPVLSICVQCLTLSSLTRFPFHDSQVLENRLGPTRQQLFRKIRSSILGWPPGGHFRALLEPFEKLFWS